MKILACTAVILEVMVLLIRAELVSAQASKGNPAQQGNDDRVVESPKNGDLAVAEERMKAADVINLKRIALALHNYHDSFNTLPAAYLSKEKKPLLSWRVLILPYLEDRADGNNALYKQFHLDEPWDSAHNKLLVEKIPKAYLAPTSEHKDGRTVYLTPRGQATAFPGASSIRMAQITDGTSNTIAVVEVADEHAVPWTKPNDWEFDPDNPLAELGGHYTEGGFHAAYCDGRVRFISNTIDQKTLAGLFTRNGGEPLPPPK